MDPLRAAYVLYRLICEIFDISPHRPPQILEDFVVKCWERWTNWAKQYLDSHPNYKEIFISAANIAAATKRAMDLGMKFVRVEIFGLPDNSPRPIVIKNEDVPLDNIRGIQSRADTNPILAMRY